MRTKIIAVFGGVYSSLGKGIISSSIGKVLTELGQKVSIVKLDPYLNTNPGNLSPYEHGEVFVTHDGYESDLDLGNYERFTNTLTTRNSNITSGQVFYEVIAKEKALGYLGKTVQFVPHITNHIKDRIWQASKAGGEADFLILEVGGTVGDIESTALIETISQISFEIGKKNFLSILVAPLIQIADEIKTKPAQHAMKTLGSLGIVPDMLALRTTKRVSEELINKIRSKCFLKRENVFVSRDLSSIYDLPEDLYHQGVHKSIFDHFNIEIQKDANIDKWTNFIKTTKNLKHNVTIGVVGKYVDLKDAYLSVNESLIFGGWECNAKVNIKYINSENANVDELITEIKDLDGILVPGGFGSRGIEGKIKAINYARTHNIPFFGICYGMQLATIEIARNIVGIKDATTEETQTAGTYVIHKKHENMQLGDKECFFKKGSIAHSIYKVDKMNQRHRHRYEFNNKFHDEFAKHPEIKFGTYSVSKEHGENTYESIELSNHKFFFAVQYHPEFLSRPEKCEPAYRSFVEACVKK